MDDFFKKIHAKYAMKNDMEEKFEAMGAKYDIQFVSKIDFKKEFKRLDEALDEANEANIKLSK